MLDKSTQPRTPEKKVRRAAIYGRVAAHTASFQEMRAFMDELNLDKCEKLANASVSILGAS